jgi:hypothetical protein
MAEFICSVWKITHGSTVLLDWDDKLTDEPEFGFGKEVEVTPLLRGYHTSIFDRVNVSRNWSWSRIVRHTDVAAAREWRMSHDIAVSNLTKGDLTIEVKDGDSYVLRDAVVQRMDTASGRSVSGHSFDSKANYSVVGGKLEIVTP